MYLCLCRNRFQDGSYTTDNDADCACICVGGVGWHGDTGYRFRVRWWDSEPTWHAFSYLEVFY